MDFEDYQEFARRFAIYPNLNFNWQYALIGLAGECGEVCNIAKKIMRDNDNIITEEILNKLKNELGDLLWYVSNVASEFKLDLNHIAISNLHKLTNRAKNNTIKGSGDNR